MHDILTGEKTVDEARGYYGYEYLAHRRGDPTPYMDQLRAPVHVGAPFRDVRVVSDEELGAAARQGRRRAASRRGRRAGKSVFAQRVCGNLLQIPERRTPCVTGMKPPPGGARRP